MAITDAQRALRAGRIGSSDATRIMAGNWLSLWQEKTGRAEPADLDLVAAVQIGIATEHLHPRFVEHATGVPCMAADRTYVHPRHDWIVAHPDFLTWDAPLWDGSAHRGAPDTVVEAKFTGGYQSDAELAQRYYWQLQHQLMVMGLERGLLSILRPNGHALVRIRRSDEDCERLMENLEAFWWHVVNDVEPSDPVPQEAPVYESRRVIDMARHNRFVSLAAMLVEQRSTALAVKEAEGALKALMPADARVAFAAGLYLARDREGRLSLRYGAPPRRALDTAEPWEAPGAPLEMSPDPSPPFQEMSLEAALSGRWGEGRDETLL
ncbi:YqaJ viral recombinase family protein [Azospirillum sp. SYSU D00513]|uniref:YqaJ viral recombinase family protein n=2 Tax=Pseudomonadati TaxID=3379134 RepID=UPI001A96D445|nr:YqaJ viral recombinase family protein [Azospirillum sp. SYSU D00513]